MFSYCRSDSHNRIEIAFRTEAEVSSQGLLLLRKHESTLLSRSSVLALAVIDGLMEVGIDDGSGSLMRIQHSSRRLDDGQWHTAVFDK